MTLTPRQKKAWYYFLILIGAIALLLFFFNSITDTQAGEVTLVWTPADGGPAPTGYKVNWGTTAPPSNEVDVGGVLTWTMPDMEDCATHYFYVRAYNTSGDSQPSEDVSAYPRPDITMVGDVEAGTRLIMGNNFDTNLKVYYDNGSGFVQLPPGDVTRESCTQIRIPDIPLLRVQVANIALPLGSGEPKDIFSQPWPGPTVSVE